MRFLITGGAGLIGSFLCRKLLELGHEVLILDDFTFSYELVPPANFVEDIQFRVNSLLRGAIIEQCSILSKRKTEHIIKAFAPNSVVHLAAIPLVAFSTRNEEAASSVLSEGLINILETVRSCSSVERFVFVSSSMVYGNFTCEPQPESGPLDPVNLYGGLKLAGEILTQAYLKRTNANYCIVRPSCVYGPTDLHRRVVQKFCEAALNGDPIDLNAKNDHTMDFTYVYDAADGLLRAATHPGAANEVFNISFGAARRLSDLARILREYAPDLRTSDVEIDDADRPTRGSLCIDKARRVLGFRPAWRLERGVAEYLAWLRSSSGARQAA